MAKTFFNNVMDFGAKGDGITDDLAAIQAALKAGCAAFPPGRFFISNTLVLDSQQEIIGAGTLKSILLVPPGGTGIIARNNYWKVADLGIWGQTAGNFTGMLIDTCQMGNIDNLFINSPTVGLRIKGQSYFNHINHININHAVQTGIEFDVDDGGTYRPNDNTFISAHINGVNTPGTIGLLCAGNTNSFIGGDIDTFETAIKVPSGSGSANYFEKIYIEHCTNNVDVESGVQYFDIRTDHGKIIQQGGTTISKFGPGSGIHPPYLPLRYLKCLLTFTDGKGTQVTDKSGNGHHGAIVNGGQWVEGMSSWAVRLTYPTQTVDLPASTIDPSIPWTCAIAWRWYSSDTINHRDYLFQITDTNGNYFSVLPMANYYQAYMRPKGQPGVEYSLNCYTNLDATQAGFNWLIFTYNPVSGKIYSLDPAYWDAGEPRSLMPNTLGQIASIQLGKPPITQTNAVMDFACAAFWQKDANWPGLSYIDAREFANNGAFLPLINL
jgi:Pectate lyase superfamily protein